MNMNWKCPYSAPQLTYDEWQTVMHRAKKKVPSTSPQKDKSEKVSCWFRFMYTITVEKYLFLFNLKKECLRFSGCKVMMMNLLS